MVDYIKIIADKINAGIPVILYTVGGDTFSIIRALGHRYNLKPTAVCDRDTQKQGQNYRGLNGVLVVSFEDALKNWPAAEFFISSMDYRFEIMGEFVHGGKITPERIINWEPVEKRNSCVFFEKSSFLTDNSRFIFCCVKNAPDIKITGDLTQSASDFCTLREGLIDGTIKDDVCEKCLYMGESWYPTSRKIWCINFFGKGICNYKCEYCNSAVHSEKELDINYPGLDTFINAMRANKLLAKQYMVILSSSGEPTLHPRRKDFYNAFDGWSMVVNTNGSVFDDELFALMQQKFIRLVVSLDAGTGPTYKQIKGLDYFDKVKDNLKRYAQAPVGVVVPKYIVVPGVNDDTHNIEGFIKLCDELNADYAIVAYDQFGNHPIPQESAEALRRMSHELNARGILCVPYAPYETFEYVKALKEALNA